ncbi:MAG: hypothetical protein HN757_09040 [Calditrichaeota bacterium]|jgi:hypothetical protein|nr:hypothetical protein [Calditrichota bacterium]
MGASDQVEERYPKPGKGVNTELRFTGADAAYADFSSFQRTSQSENPITVGWTFLSDHPLRSGFTSRDPISPIEQYPFKNRAGAMDGQE